MTTDFANFLTDCLAEGEDIFMPESEPLSATEIAEAEKRLGISLPDSYKYFLLNLGAGSWCGEHVAHPDELYAFDADCPEIEGLVALVQNARGVGDYVAYNPQSPPLEGERPVFYCSHNPFGCLQIAESFEGWVRKMKKARAHDADIYEEALSGSSAAPGSFRDI